MKTICLIGFMGSGKSSVGRQLAALMGVPFRDLDRHIVEREGRSIPEIFSADGEEGFRQIETAALRELLAGNPAPGVLSLGGGTPTRPEAAQLLRDSGALCVYLRGSTQTLRSHLTGKGIKSRPMLQRGNMDSLLAERSPLYESLADITIDIDGLSVPEVAQIIAAEILARR